MELSEWNCYDLTIPTVHSTNKSIVKKIQPVYRAMVGYIIGHISCFKGNRRKMAGSESCEVDVQGGSWQLFLKIPF